MPIQEPHDPLKCYCGKPTKMYDCLFRRNFCSDECSDDLRIFLGGTDKVVEINRDIPTIKAGDFKIRGGVVTLSETLQKHEIRKAESIDKIDAQISAGLEKDKLFHEMKRKFPNMPDSVIEAMVKAKG